MRWLIYFLSVILGLFFIISGISKIFPIEPFEFIFVEKGIFSWVIASFAARIIIAIEISLGLLLIFNQYVRFTTVSILILLSVFSIFILYDLLILGNNSDCGCMGTWLKFTNTQSLLKNFLLLFSTIIVYKFSSISWSKWWITALIILAPVVTIFIINTVTFSHEFVYNPDEKVEIEFEKFSNITNENDTINFKKGNRLIAFFSSQCPHCKIAAQKIELMNKKMKLPPITFVFLGRDSTITKFREETKSTLPYIRTEDIDLFFNQTNSVVPCIYYLENGIVKNRWYEYYVIEKDIEKISLNN